MKGVKRKGGQYERDLSQYINEATGLESFRASLSGGGLIDLPATCDILGTHVLFIEVKRVERFRFCPRAADTPENLIVGRKKCLSVQRKRQFGQAS